MPVPRVRRGKTGSTMTEIEGQWIKEMVSPDVILSAGISLMIIGGIIYGIGRSLYAKAVVDIREGLIGETKRQRDNLKQDRLREEVVSIHRMPRIGMAMIVTGAVILTAAIVMYIIG